MMLTKLHYEERNRIRATAIRVRKLYPGPAGELLSEDLDAWADFGYRFDNSGLIAKLIHQVWTTLLPGETELPVSQLSSQPTE